MCLSVSKQFFFGHKNIPGMKKIYLYDSNGSDFQLNLILFPRKLVKIFEFSLLIRFRARICFIVQQFFNGYVYLLIFVDFLSILFSYYIFIFWAFMYFLKLVFLLIFFKSQTLLFSLVFIFIGTWKEIILIFFLAKSSCKDNHYVINSIFPVNTMRTSNETTFEKFEPAEAILHFSYDDLKQLI